MQVAGFLITGAASTLLFRGPERSGPRACFVTGADNAPAPAKVDGGRTGEEEGCWAQWDLVSECSHAFPLKPRQQPRGRTTRRRGGGGAGDEREVALIPWFMKGTSRVALLGRNTGKERRSGRRAGGGAGDERAAGRQRRSSRTGQLGEHDQGSKPRAMAAGAAAGAAVEEVAAEDAAVAPKKKGKTRGGKKQPPGNQRHQGAGTRGGSDARKILFLNNHFGPQGAKTNS
jgi:hypothetical protein